MRTSPDAIRYDSATIELVSSTEKEQFLRFRVAFARAGVFPYYYLNGTIRREAKLPEDLFSEDAIASARGIPATDDHPPVTENEGLLTTANATRFAKGALGDSIEVGEGEILWGNETVWDEELKASLLRGEKLEVSVGSRCKIDETPGEYKGQPYDVRQTNIRFNHVAHVTKGRAGSEVRAYLDHANPDLNIAIRIDSNDKENQRMKRPEFLAAAEAFLKSVGVKLDSAEGATDDPAKPTPDPATPTPQESKKDEIPPAPTAAPMNNDSVLIKALQDQVKLLEETLNATRAILEQALSPATQDSIARRRLSLIDSVRSVDPEAKTDALSERELKLLVVTKVLPPAEGVKLDSFDDVKLDAHFQASMELARTNAALRTGIKTSGNQTQANLDADQEIAKIKQDRLQMAQTKEKV
ncbi:DUF2213 domain-containing protein [Leptospira bandrabouensis]|uniref:DUF2213 domain-containing protein n=1 Tax=Leptospira bandrabouensis TaxID=2484903 RepID=UPI00223E2EB7|nr:DUF2213 domain-containing protein [Leptospira bandrabouensis]MCW7459553.1 DUF2213 domain-containing protein [Leptospira bandrabouensis]MCW7478429.1 DUF2213 domain-containing protein [Leptospira bandrabouensis]MCW7486287.1 DUF2213 domain-containing protein [Leptospira bandrabouensis]